jgi:mannose-6-phosphate isomerase-like protein (cupin superfamily)
MSTSAHRTATDEIDFLGNPARVLVDGETAGGAYCLVESSGPRGDMPPLHVHHADDEAFYVLDGRLTIFVGDGTIDLTAGGCAFAPRGIAHTYRVESESARWLVAGSPAGFDAFVREVGDAGSDAGPAELAEISGRHGIELLGPPGMLPRSG